MEQTDSQILTSTILGNINGAHAYLDVDRVGHPDMFGVDHVIEFLRRYLVEDRDEIDPVLLPLPQILMLYGRPGSGKRTCLHYVQDRNTNLRLFLEGGTFEWVKHFRLQEWDDGEFVTWCEEAREIIRTMNATRAQEKHSRDNNHDQYPSGPRSLLLVVGDLHYMNGWRTPEGKFAAQNLMQTIREISYNRRDDVRLVLTCGESPGKFGERLLSMVDRKCFMGVLEPEDRGAMFIYWMRRFKLLADEVARLRTLEWSVKLDVEIIQDDPGHIVNTLIYRSNGCNAREIYDFMRRTFDACSKPRDDGMTDYCGSLIMKMMYKDEKQNSQITPYNTYTMDAPLLQYANLDPEVKLREKNRFVMGSNTFKDAGQEEEEGQEPSPKKRKSQDKDEDEDEEKKQERAVERDLKIQHSNLKSKLRISDALRQADAEQRKLLRLKHNKRDEQANKNAFI